MSGGNYQSERFRINFPLKKYLVLCWPNEQIFRLKWCWWLCHQNLKLATNTVRHQHICSRFWPKKRILFKNCDFQVKIWDWFMSKKNLGRIFLGLRKLLLVWKINFARKINYEILFRQLWNFQKKIRSFHSDDFRWFCEISLFEATTNEIKNNSKILFVPKKMKNP